MSEDIPVRAHIMRKAESLTVGNRNKEYGDPYDNYKSVADAFTALTGKSLTAADISKIHMLVKMVRMNTSPLKEDNYVDLAAYAGITLECEIAERREK